MVNKNYNMKNTLKSKFDELLDDFSGQFDLLNFENEYFIPIEYDEILNQISTNYFNGMKGIELIFNDDSLKKFEVILEKSEMSLNNVGLVNTYISLGSIKYEDNLAPCLLIPILIKKHQDKYYIFRNHNQNIQSNILLDIVLNEDYSIKLPVFRGDIQKFINQLNAVDGIEYQKAACISNFDLRFNHIFLDLEFEGWNNFDEKFNMFINDESIYNYSELNKFKSELDNQIFDLNISKNYLFLKSLLFKNDAVLVIGDKSIRNKIKTNFNSIKSETLLLEISNDLSKEEFQKSILDNDLFFKNEEIPNLDELEKKYECIKKIDELINRDYSFFSPKHIKNKKDYYLNRINGLQIDNYFFDITDVLEYDYISCNIMKNKIIDLFVNHKEIFQLGNYFSLIDLTTNKFYSFINLSETLEGHFKNFLEFNNYLNKRYSINIFDNLFSVDVLNNIDVLNKSVRYLDADDIHESNNLIKNYYNENISSEDYDSIIEIDNNVKYTELINKGIIDEDKIEFIKKDFKTFIDFTNYLMDYSTFLIKEFNKILDFYNQFHFEIDNNLLNVENSIEDLSKLLHCYKEHVSMLIDLNEFISSNSLNDDVLRFVEFIFENDIKQKEIEIVFWFNIYNSLLNRFLNDNKNIDEDKIISGYESQLKSLKKKLNKHDKSIFIQKIYSKSVELNNTPIVSNQKKEILRDISDDNINSIRDYLDKYKEFITANKRVFLMDMASVSQFLSSEYENYFDHVILTTGLKYSLDELSLLLRSKNKIILIECEGDE